MIIRGKADGFGFREAIETQFKECLPLPESVILQSIKDCNNLVNKIYCRKRKNDEYDFLKENIRLLRLIFIVVIVGFVILALSDKFRETLWVFYLGLATLSVGGLLVVVIAILLLLQEPQHINLFGEMTF